MKCSFAILFVAALTLAQAPKSQVPAIKHPRLAFVPTDGAAIVDTDMFDAQKYIEESGSDSTSAKAQRTAHETALMREFMDGFNQARECDGIVLMGAGDQKPDFSVQVMVDSHDTPKQKPVWVYVLRNMGTNKLAPVGSVDSGKEAAAGICRTVWTMADEDSKKVSQASSR